MKNNSKKRKIYNSLAYGTIAIACVILSILLVNRLFLPLFNANTSEWSGTSEDLAAVILPETEGDVEKNAAPEAKNEKSAVTEKNSGAETGDNVSLIDDAGQEGQPDLETNSEGQTGDEPEGKQMTILMVGDILLHTRVEDSARREDGSYNFDAVFENVSDEIMAADLAIVNQEVIMGGTELKITGYPNFNAPYEIGDALIKAGFDVICHATNHALDRHEQGILNTLAFWRKYYPDAGVLGIHDNAQDQNEIYTFAANGITVAILNYTYGTNGIQLPEGMPYAVNLLERERILTDLAKAEECADFTIVVPHWGTEYRLTEDDRQKMWAKLFLENGADLVLGAHPHVIEPVTWLTDEATGDRMLVYYSVGNFVNWTGESVAGAAARMVGGMAQVTLTRDEDGRVSIAEYGVEPIVCHVETGQDKVTVYRLSDYSQEMADKNEIRLQDAAFSLEYCRELCEKVWGEIPALENFKNSY